MDVRAKASSRFDALLLATIDETLNYVLGESNAKIVYQYLEAEFCKKEEIPQKLDYFSTALHDLIGTGRGQMYGAACIIEATIAEAFALKFGRHFAEKGPFDFPGYINKLKQWFLEKESENIP
jgi:hypothetical protein